MSTDFKTIIVTGGAGFLGRHLCAKLLDNPNNQIICLDNFITGKPSNIEEFFIHPRFTVINHDVIQTFHVEHVDEIYHLASIASPDKYKAHPLETIFVNVKGTENMLELARKHGAKILLTSTSEVYGDPLIHPQSEEYYGNVNTVGERSCYDESKRLAETLMYEYRKLYGVDAKIVRLFNTYGPYMDEKDGRVITNFLYGVLRDEPIKIYGDGTQTRSFCYVDDLIEGLVKMMASEENGPINLGNPYCEFSLNELVSILSSVTGKKIDVQYINATQDDPKCRKPVISKAIALLGWKPVVMLQEGLTRMVEFILTSKNY